ncbi:MAG: type II toxin-antitoxin system HicA family toxin [Gemmataceae bacterium]|nr:type II toxin-antitoxin system HicA family toxin [Gemmataceae bacterium]
MTVREVLRRLRADGWVQTGQKGSHRQFEHPTRPGKVTVAGSPSRDLPPKTLASIRRQAGWEDEA